MKRSSAFTLIEMMLTMTMGSALMILSIGLVHQALSLSKLGKVRGDHDLTVNRLARQFRSDIHSAASLKAASTESLELSMADGTSITYAVTAANVRRVQTMKEGPGAHEQFQFEPLCNIAFQSLSGGEVVQLQLERRFSDQQTAPRIELQVIAGINRWRELELLQTGGQP